MSARIPAGTLTSMTRQWSVLIRAGISVVPALQMLERSTAKPALSSLLAELRRDVEGGHPCHRHCSDTRMCSAPCMSAWCMPANPQAFWKR